ncbi:MAG: WbqC family protein [Prevotellaceae bacterium]|nr:WbqC family protein [Prevotellaceae bacterium]
MQNTVTHLSTAYLPPVQYFCKLATAEHVLIEKHEHYLKQTFRSRCQILSANGVLDLSIPIEKRHGEKMPIGTVRIDYQTEWQRQHWRSLVAAYSSSPFFMYYADELKIFYTQRYDLLLNFNTQLTRTICELIGARRSLDFTEKYEHSVPNDFRMGISPKSLQKIEDNNFSPVEYYQVFSAKFGFTPNLSIVDLLFNEGPDTLQVLKSSAV